MNEKNQQKTSLLKRNVASKKKIRELDQCLAKRKAEAENLKQRVDALESENARLQDWVDRLLEYTELSKEDFMAMVESDKNIAKVVQLGEKMMNISKFWM